MLDAADDDADDDDDDDDRCYEAPWLAEECPGVVSSFGVRAGLSFGLFGLGSPSGLAFSSAKFLCPCCHGF